MKYLDSRRSTGVFLAACGLLGVVWAASSGAPLSAQTAQQSQLLHVTEVQLKPDTAPAWAQFQEKEQIPAQRKGGLARRDTWASAQTGDTYLRLIVTPVSSLAQYDGGNPLTKAIGAEAAQALGEKNRRFVNTSRGYIIRTRPELGFGTRPANPNIAMLTRVTVINGKSAEYEAFVKNDVLPGLKKGGVGYYAVSQTVYGGDANDYTTLMVFENFAELAKGHPLERALGPEGFAKLALKSGASVSKVERTILRYLPNLSFGSPAGTSH